jgi:BMFP domain-containing protein YqiC
MTTSNLFVPTLHHARAPESPEKNVRAAMIAALSIPEIARVISPFKANGSVTGHKVGDNIKAVEALIAAAYPHLRRDLEDERVSLFRKSQILDGVLRREYEVDAKTGKLTGHHSQSYQLRLARQEARSAAAQNPAAQSAAEPVAS